MKIINFFLIPITIISFIVCFVSKNKYETLLNKRDKQILQLNKQIKECNEDNKELFLFFTSGNK